MSAPFQVLRFRRPGSAGRAVPGNRVLLDLWLDDATAPIGHIVELAAGPGTPVRWAFLLADGRPTGLHSTHSRQDLESRVLEHYFHDLTAERRHSA